MTRNLLKSGIKNLIKSMVRFVCMPCYQRYIGQDEDMELRLTLEELNDEIEDNQKLKEKATEKITNISRKQEGIRNSFMGIALLVTGVEQKKQSLEGLLKTCFGGLDTIMDRIGNRNIEMILDEMDEVGYKPTGQGKEEVDTFKEAEDQRKKKKEETEDTEAIDDDEVYILSVSYVFDDIIIGSNKGIFKKTG